MSKRKKKNHLTVVRSMEPVVHYELVGLRRFIDERLELKRMSNTDAAARAGCSKARWSQLKGATALTPNELGMIADGLGMHVRTLVAELMVQS